jgi:hypothetical protein
MAKKLTWQSLPIQRRLNCPTEFGELGNLDGVDSGEGQTK